MEEIEKRISEINKEMEELVEKAKGIAGKQQEAQVRERGGGGREKNISLSFLSPFSPGPVKGI